MRLGFYPRLAFSNLSKNRRLYIPHILTGMGLVAVFYILLTLAGDERLHDVRGGNYLPDIMFLGILVMAVLSVILLLYTNSFLMKQRKREFGLYNVLGLEKRHVCRVLLFETLFSALASILLGLVLGVILYKLCALLICRIMQVDSVLGFYYIRPFPLLAVGASFAGMYLLTYLLNLIQIARLRPVELLSSTQTGEREPKVKWLLLLAGLGTLGAGYYIALTTRSPLRALNLFFIAVILVIIGTYCLFITGSIALLKLLKNNPNFYYRKRHMVSVSGLLYRMKQNAVGLASIAILATSVLVMVSTTVCLYTGIEDTLEQQFPHPMYFNFSYSTTDGGIKNLPFEVQADFADRAAEENGLEISFMEEHTYLAATYLNENGELSSNIPDDDYFVTLSGGLCTVFFLTDQEYEKLTGTALHLGKNQCAVYSLPGNQNTLSGDFRLAGEDFTVTETLTGFPENVDSFSAVDVFGVVVSDNETLQTIYQAQKRDYGEHASEFSSKLMLDFTDREKAGQVYQRLWMSMGDQMQAYVDSQPDAEGGWGSASNCIWDAREEMYGINGTLFFLGLILALVFLFATALIIYYKQISEGYEDRQRFQILQKVGMSQREVKQTIHSQILLVFFLPLLVAAVHISIAFPMLTKLLRVILSTDIQLFLLCAAGAFGVFAVIYVTIYGLTARVYYQIVR